tara:strand:- start:306 stop:968 length:663 start_codon:yes stop_codon:yes gene_type:complete
MPHKDPEVRKAYFKAYDAARRPRKTIKLWYNDSHAECGECHERLPKENFYKSTRGGRSPCKEGCRNVYTVCKLCQKKIQGTSESLSRKSKIRKRRLRETPIEIYTYNKYRYKVGVKNVDITEEEWMEKYWPKDGKCPYFYIELKHYGGKRETGMNIPFDSPSIDRVDNTKGYSRDNIEVVSTRWNLLKRDSTVEERFAIGKEAALKLGYKWPPEPAERRK